MWRMRHCANVLQSWHFIADKDNGINGTKNPDDGRHAGQGANDAAVRQENELH